MNRRNVILGLSVATLTAGCEAQVKLGPEAVAGKTPDAFVSMRQVQAAYIGSGNSGGGYILYRNRTYPFQVGGLGVGGIGISEIEAEGDVYNLADISMFPGSYGQARYGFAIGTLSSGDLWLQNEAGVIMRLNAKRRGLMLSLGGDVVVIQMT